MRSVGNTSEEPKPRLPDGTESFYWMLRDSIVTVASRETPFAEAARLFGERYGTLLALTDGLRDMPGRDEHTTRMLEATRGVIAHGKKVLQDAWDERAQPAVARETKDMLAALRAEASAEGGSGAFVDPFLAMPAKLDWLDALPDRTEAAGEFACLWARLRHMPTVLRPMAERAQSEERELVLGAMRSAGRWTLELEETWGTRTFVELFGHPTLEQLLRLVFPDLPAAGRSE